MASLTAPITNLSNFPFTPLQIAGCAVWFDSADSNTYSGSGTTGFQWRSKGVHTLTASVSAGPGPAAATCNAAPCIYFSNATTKLITGTIPTLGATGTTWITAATTLVTPASQPDAAVVIASLSPEKAIRWSGSNGFMIYAVEGGGAYGSSAASSNGVRGFTQSSGAFTAYQNGVVNSNVVPPSYSGGTNVSFTMGQWNTSGLIGWINEILIYNSVLTVAQYQQVEGYLAWKYGYAGSLPATHPNFRAAPSVAGQPTSFLQSVAQTVTLIEPVRLQNTSFWRLFKPAALPNCVGWYDGQDPLGTGSAPANGAAVTTWFDKSGRTNHATSVGSNPTYNSNGSIVFNGSNTLRFTDPNALVASNTFSLFVVEQRSAQTANYNYWLAGSTVVQNTNLQFGYRNSNDVTLGFFNNDVDFSSVPNPGALEPFRVWDGIYDGAAQTIYLNGSNVASRAQTTNITSWSNGSIGYYGPDNTFYRGTLGEILIYKPVLNDIQRQQVEGYLSYKWGLQSNLPVTHPVASNQSAILFSNVVIPFAQTKFVSGTNRWQPNAFSGLALWLDAADAGTVTLSPGTINVTAWRDKAQGTSFNTQGSSSFLNLTPNSINGNQSLYFDNTSANNITLLGNLTQPSSFSLFVVWKNLTQRNYGYRNIFGWQFAATPPNPGAFNFGYPGTQTGLNIGIWDTVRGEIRTLIPVSNNTSYIGFSQYSASPSLSINGNTPSSTIISSTAGASNLYIGGAPLQQVSIYLGEVILYNIQLTTAQRQLVEGYLAWKWGLRANLPANHPNKNVPPS